MTRICAQRQRAKASSHNHLHAQSLFHPQSHFIWLIIIIIIYITGLTLIMPMKITCTPNLSIPSSLYYSLLASWHLQKCSRPLSLYSTVSYFFNIWSLSKYLYSLLLLLLLFVFLFYTGTDYKNKISRRFNTYLNLLTIWRSAYELHFWWIDRLSKNQISYLSWIIFFS